MVSGEGERRRCALALAVLVGLLLSLVAGIALPWMQRNARQDELIEQHRRQLERYHAIIDRLPALEQRLAAVRDSRALDVFYIDATNAANGGISLQRLVEELTGAAGGNLTSIQILSPSEQDAVVKVSVRLRFSGNTEALQRLLYAIESSQPLLFIESMDVRSLRRNRRLRRKNQAVRNYDLNANMVVFGYIRKPSA